MNRIIAFTTALFLMVQTTKAQQTGSWGDQGNGFYKNPVLEANYPDNDVIKVGDTFYMMTSTNHWSPGMMIVKSKDLVNWTFSNNILQAPITFDKEYNIGQPKSLANRGTWAGSFGFNGEYYFAYWCFNKNHLKDGNLHILYSKSKSLEGVWTVPEELTFADGSPINTTDPGVMWDLDTKKAWICITLKGTVKIFPLSWDGKKILQNTEEGIVVTKKLEGESNKIYKFDGNYFVMNSYVATHDSVVQRMQAFHKAKNIEGPWEGKIVLENGNGTDRSPSQGSLLKLEDGSWWFLHQLARGEANNRYNGRPQMLEPVSWKNGWPLIGVDTDGDGIGEVVWENKKPILGSPITAPATDDDFNTSELGLQWNWRFNPRMDRWSLKERAGFLRLKSCISLPVIDKESIKKVPNLIAQRLMGRYKNVMTAKVDVSGMVNGQEGGLHVSSGDNTVIGVNKDSIGRLNLFFKSDTSNVQPVKLVNGIDLKQSDIWLQARVENGLATFHYSLNGKEFLQMGGKIRLTFSGFTPNMVGFYTMNSEEKGYIDVDWFKYDYDGPKGN